MDICIVRISIWLSCVGTCLLFKHMGHHVDLRCLFFLFLFFNLIESRKKGIKKACPIEKITVNERVITMDWNKIQIHQNENHYLYQLLYVVIIYPALVNEWSSNARKGSARLPQEKSTCHNWEQKQQVVQSSQLRTLSAPQKSSVCAEQEAAPENKKIKILTKIIFTVTVTRKDSKKILVKEENLGLS